MGHLNSYEIHGPSSRKRLCIPRRIPWLAASIIFCSCVTIAAFLGLQASSRNAGIPSLARQVVHTDTLQDWWKGVGEPSNSQQNDDTMAKRDKNGRTADYDIRSDKVSADAPGEMGQPVPFSALGKLEAQARAVYKKERFNLVASDAISLQRKLPDNRGERCRHEKYAWSLPRASVIIVFYNEPLSSLLRTVWSVLNRSLPDYLHEIILIDDASEREELGEKLENYLQMLSKNFASKLRILRHLQHRGLIQAKILGARNATAEVLVFLDSHCEVTVGWLEPLLARVKANRKLVACPLVDTLKADTLGLIPSAEWATGLFTWSLYYKWGPHGMTAAENERVKDVSFEPHKTPTFPGGLFAVDRSWFLEVGSYDEEMQGWGGENLEMSFRVWMCGGEIEFVPCSRVAHVSRDHTYHFEQKTLGINGARLAEVWLDDYKRLFYLHRPLLRNASVGDLSARKRLREDLQCHNFKWFLENVYAEKFIPDEDVLAYGQIKNEKQNQCLHTDANDEHGTSTFSLKECLSPDVATYSLQLFSLSKENELRREEWCIDVSSTPAASTSPLLIAEFPCDAKALRQWKMTKNLKLINLNSKGCLEAFKDTAILKPCDAAIPSQQWHFVSPGDSELENQPDSMKQILLT